MLVGFLRARQVPLLVVVVRKNLPSFQTVGILLHGLFQACDVLEHVRFGDVHRAHHLDLLLGLGVQGREVPVREVEPHGDGRNRDEGGECSRERHLPRDLPLTFLQGRFGFDLVQNTEAELPFTGFKGFRRDPALRALFFKPTVFVLKDFDVFFEALELDFRRVLSAEQRTGEEPHHREREDRRDDAEDDFEVEAGGRGPRHVVLHRAHVTQPPVWKRRRRSRLRPP